jgi:glycosyltransferase involved in cell wall biosynthesis
MDSNAPAGGPPRISLIIPAFNEEGFIGNTLQSLKAAADRYAAKTGRVVELIVVNNASTDKTEEIARSQGARVAFEPVRQIAAVRNRGFQESRGEIVVTCDADNWVSPNLFERVDQVMSAGAIGGGVRIRPEKGPWLAHLMFSFFNFWADLFGMSFGILFTDRATFQKIGGFPTDVYVGEDAWFVVALKREARRQKRPYANLRDAYIVTSLRKIREFGALQQLGTYLKFLFFPWLTRRKESCPTWYDVRSRK